MISKFWFLITSWIAKRVWQSYLPIIIINNSYLKVDALFLCIISNIYFNLVPVKAVERLPLWRNVLHEKRGILLCRVEIIGTCRHVTPGQKIVSGVLYIFGRINRQSQEPVYGSFLVVPKVAITNTCDGIYSGSLKPRGPRRAQNALVDRSGLIDIRVISYL